MHRIDIDPVHASPDVILDCHQPALLQIRQDPLQELALMASWLGRSIHIFQACREQVGQSSRQAAVALILYGYGVMNQSRIGWILIRPLVQYQIRRTAGQLAALADVIGCACHALLAVHAADHDPVDQAAGGKLSYIQLQMR